ncbi:TPA: tetratricopeptide repeat protein, partial [Candidatus Woesearchaeota archaeon]|nr:tetratricopeptide repeat protein [Candidatus Woesearchaeota archaeon]
MSKKVCITIILALSLCLASIPIFALAPIPDVGPSGCVPAPGMPCGTNTGSGSTPQKTTTPTKPYQQTGGYTATKPDEPKTEQPKKEDIGKVEIIIHNHVGEIGEVYDVYTGERPLDETCPSIHTVDCIKKCGWQTYYECQKPCFEENQRLGEEWTKCYHAWSDRHSQLLEAYNQQHYCGDEGCPEDIEVPSDLKDAVADKPVSDVNQQIRGLLGLVNIAMTAGEIRDFSKQLELLNKAMLSKQMTNQELEQFVDSLQKYLVTRIPAITDQAELTAVASAMASLSLAMEEAKTRGDKQMLERLKTGFERSVNDVIALIEKNKLENGKSLSKGQIEWADNMIDALNQAMKQMKALGNQEAATKAQMISNDLRDALNSATDNRLDVVAAQLDIDDSMQRTMTEEKKKLEQKKGTTNQRLINEKLDEARAKVQEMLEAKYRKTMTLEEFEAKNRDYQSNRDAVVNIFKDVLSQQPTNEEANFALATIYRQDNRKAEAKEFYERAIMGSAPNTRQTLINGIKDEGLKQEVLIGLGLAEP